MQDITLYKNLYRHRFVAVLGGGPSLPADLERLPPTAIKISVNHHATKLTECFFMVFMDDLNKLKTRRPATWSGIMKFNGVKVSQIREQSDVDFAGVDYWDGGFSASLATWFACYMGGAPVILCGMDLFRGDKAYFHDETDNQVEREKPVENHLNAWRPALTKCPNADNIRVISGPLLDLFRPWLF